MRVLKVGHSDNPPRPHDCVASAAASRIRGPRLRVRPCNPFPASSRAVPFAQGSARLCPDSRVLEPSDDRLLRGVAKLPPRQSFAVESSPSWSTRHLAPLGHDVEQDLPLLFKRIIRFQGSRARYHHRSPHHSRISTMMTALSPIQILLVGKIICLS